MSTTSVHMSASTARFAKKFKRSRRYAREDTSQPAFFAHDKHLFIMSWSGRPIYTRYGDDTRLSSFLGVCSAIVSNFQRIGDEVRTIIVGRTKFVFLLKGPIYLLAVSRTAESVNQLRLQLEYAHSLIISALTHSVVQMLESQPNYDVRNLLGDMNTLLSDLIDSCDRSPAFFLDSAPCLRIGKAVRSHISQVLNKNKPKSLLYGLVLVENKLVSVVRDKDSVLAASDTLLIINYVANSQSLRSNPESWTPICLPKFSDQGFVYAYVTFLSPAVCLLLITTDATEFQTMRECKARIQLGFDTHKTLRSLHEAADTPLHVRDFHTGVAELKHVLFRADAHAQFVLTAPAPPYHTRKLRRMLFRRYQHVHSRVNPEKGFVAHTVYWERTDDVVVLACCKPGEYEIYAAFTPLVRKDVALAALMTIARWMRKEEGSFFIA